MHVHYKSDLHLHFFYCILQYVNITTIYSFYTIAKLIQYGGCITISDQLYLLLFVPKNLIVSKILDSAKFNILVNT